MRNQLRLPACRQLVPGPRQRDQHGCLTPRPRSGARPRAKTPARTSRGQPGSTLVRGPHARGQHARQPARREPTWLVGSAATRRVHHRRGTSSRQPGCARLVRPGRAATGSIWHRCQLTRGGVNQFGGSANQFDVQHMRTRSVYLAGQGSPGGAPERTQLGAWRSPSSAGPARTTDAGTGHVALRHAHQRRAIPRRASSASVDPPSDMPQRQAPQPLSGLLGRHRPASRPIPRPRRAATTGGRSGSEVPLAWAHQRLGIASRPQIPAG